MIRAFLISTSLLLATGCAVEPAQDQLLASIESRLTPWNVGPVDYENLTQSQRGALHLALTNAPSPFSVRAPLFRQELLTILRWDGSELNHSLNKPET